MDKEKEPPGGGRPELEKYHPNCSVSDVNGIDLKQEIDLDMEFKIEPDQSDFLNQMLDLDDPVFPNVTETDAQYLFQSVPRNLGQDALRSIRAKLSARLRRSLRGILKTVPESDVYRSLYATVSLERIEVDSSKFPAPKTKNDKAIKFQTQYQHKKKRGRPAGSRVSRVTASVPKRNLKEPKKSQKVALTEPEKLPKKSKPEKEVVSKPEKLPKKSKPGKDKVSKPEKLPKDPKPKPTADPSKCEECNKSFTRFAGLKYHQRSVHGIGRPVERKFTCQACPKSFIKRSHLKMHEQTHTGESLYKCRFCDQSFRGSTGRKFHEDAVHGDGERKLKPNTSSSRKSSRTPGAPRQKYTPPFICAYCSKPFPRHSTKVIHERSHTGEKPYLCTICGTSFKLSISLREHNKSVHTAERDNLCAVCGQGFSRKMSLKYHILRNHSSRDDWFKCQVPGCTQAFVQRQKLERHIRNIHSRGRIQCRKCTKGFEPGDAGMEKLKKHMDLHDLRERRKLLGPRKPKKPKVPKKPRIPIHNPNRRRPREYNIKCTYCDKMFAWPSDRHRHEILIHLKKDSYPCERCDVQFKSIYRLWAHNKEVHNRDLQDGPPRPRIKRSREHDENVLVRSRTRTSRNSSASEQSSSYEPPPFQYSTWATATPITNANPPQVINSGPSREVLWPLPQEQAPNYYQQLNQITYHLNQGIPNQPSNPSDHFDDNDYDDNYSTAPDSNNQYDDGDDPTVPDYDGEIAEDPPPLIPIPVENNIVKPKKRGPAPKPRLSDKRPLPKRNKPCPICGKLFRTNQRVNEHVKTHNKPAPPDRIPCPDCNRTFKTEYCLLIHRVIHDATLRPFPCKKPNCNESFNSSVTLKQHLDLAHTDPNSGPGQIYICDHEQCGHKFQTERSLKSHKKLHLEIKNHSCSHPGCNLAFRTSSLLKRHVQIHLDDSERVRPFKCTECDRTYIRHDGLKQHLVTFHRIMPPNREPSSCPICFKVFEFKWNRNTHIRRIHQNKRNPPLKNPRKPQTPLFSTCETCDWGFENWPKLKKHYLIEHEKKLGHTKHQCPKEDCEKFYYLWKKLKAHILDQHGEAEMDVAINSFGSEGPPENEQEVTIKERKSKIKQQENYLSEEEEPSKVKPPRKRKPKIPRSTEKVKLSKKEQKVTTKIKPHRKRKAKPRKLLSEDEEISEDEQKVIIEPRRNSSRKSKQNILSFRELSDEEGESTEPLIQIKEEKDFYN